MEGTMTIELRRIGAGIAVVLAILASPTAAQDARAADNSAASAHGPLDGMSFVGKIGPEDNRDLDDELHFAAGQFWSTNCVACGYQPGTYWSRRVGDSIHFHGTLQSAEGGRFDYSGRVVGGQVDVRINWTQQRWYGDIERKLAFVGALAPAAPLPGVPALSTGRSSDASAQCRRL
jgi:hypothetical protein